MSPQVVVPVPCLPAPAARIRYWQIPHPWSDPWNAFGSHHSLSGTWCSRKVPRRLVSRYGAMDSGSWGHWCVQVRHRMTGGNAEGLPCGQVGLSASSACLWRHLFPWSAARLLPPCGWLHLFFSGSRLAASRFSTCAAPATAPFLPEVAAIVDMVTDAYVVREGNLSHLVNINGWSRTSFAALQRSCCPDGISVDGHCIRSWCVLLRIPASENCHLQFAVLAVLQEFHFSGFWNCIIAKTAGCNKGSTVAV